MILKQSTAVDVLIGPFVDITDGATSEPGETPAVKLSKNGQALAAKNDATVPVFDADGYYNCQFDATDTNTVGTLILTVAASATALPVRHEFQVIEEAVYDAIYGASAGGYLQPTIAGRTLDVTATGAAGIDWGNVENPTTAVDLSGTDIQLVDTTTTNTDMRGTDSAATAAALATAQTDLDTLTDPITLPGQEAPDETPTLQYALAMLYKRNVYKSNHDGTENQYFDSAGTTIDQKESVTKNGAEVTIGKTAAGP